MPSGANSRKRRTTRMATKEYQKECKFCKQQIRMVETNGKWTAHNLNNGLHDCRKKEQEQNHKEITLEMVQRKLESIGIIINVERLMKQE
jgi:hypothetical protein